MPPIFASSPARARAPARASLRDHYHHLLIGKLNSNADENALGHGHGTYQNTGGPAWARALSSDRPTLLSPRKSCSAMS
jgi:hypothetical protein